MKTRISSQQPLFRHLRNRLIAINLLVTTIVLAVAFLIIYTTASGTMHRRPMMPDNGPKYTNGVSDIIEERIKSERHASLNSLLLSLIVTGVCVEFAVAILSYYLAETAIRPVREAYEAQKTFIANASHEIKTPLAAISANLEAADISGNRWIDNITREVQTLTTLNHELLILARSDGAIEVANQPTINPKVVIDELLQTYEPEAKAHDLELTFSTQSANYTSVAQNDFRQIATILLDNAIKYGQKTINISLGENYLEVENDGVVIPENALPHIFERFYQVDKSSDGVGLGLAIAWSLADRHGWKITATSAETTSLTLNF